MFGMFLKVLHHDVAELTESDLIGEAGSSPQPGILQVKLVGNTST